jgi:hypothetical protein
MRSQCPRLPRKNDLTRRLARLTIAAALGFVATQERADAQLRRAKTNDEVRHLMGRKIEYPKLRGASTPNCFRFESPRQSGVKCGPNSLYILLKLEGIDVAYDDVIGAVELTESGSNLADLRRAAARFGLACEVKYLTPQDLIQMTRPLVVHFDIPSGESPQAVNHFDVINRFYGSRKSDRMNFFEAIDSTNGDIKTFDQAFIARNFTGYCLIPTRTGRLGVLNPLLLSAVVALTALNLVIDRRLNKKFGPLG